MKKEKKSFLVTQETTNPLRIDSFTKSKITNTKKTNYKEKKYYTQSLIGIKEIYDGFFFMNNGQIIGILEIYPINFNQRTDAEKRAITLRFQQLFLIAPKVLHFKLRTEKADIRDIVASIKAANSHEKDPRVIQQMNDYIQNIIGIQGKDTYHKKFYWIYEYEGDFNGKRSSVKKEIIKHMNEVKWTLINQFKTIGNSVVIPSTRWEVLMQPLETVYKHFNSNSCKEEPFESRYFRLRADEIAYNDTHKGKREIKDCDYVAARGIHLHKKAKDTLIMDGEYYTYLVINDNGYPEGSPGVACGWISNLLSGIDGVDIDIIAKKLPHDSTLELLKQNKKLTITRRNSKRSNPDKYEELKEKTDNMAYVIDRMSDDEDLYDLVTIITIKAASLNELNTKKNAIINTLKKNSIYVTTSYRIRIPLLRMTMPFMYIDNSIFTKFSHNFLTSSMTSLYWYSTYELMDPNGYVIGINLLNSTLVVLNNFFKKYVNPHILLLGTSGAGKTFTEQMLGYRMRLMGMKVVYIIPSKGMLDYSGGCENMGGSFIKLGPLQQACINILQIRPEENLETEEISLLAKKITFVTTFIQLLMGEEELMTTTEVSNLNHVLENMYRDFGITHLNDSIYIEGTNEVKPMPIVEDLYERTKDIPSLERITEVLKIMVFGSCKNMNQQTNVDLSNDYIVFDVDEETISPRLFSAYLYLAFDCAYSIAKKSIEEYCAIFLDEVWKLMKSKLSGEQVKSMVKLLRAYHSCVVLATQDIEDFINTTGEFGKSILTNTAIKIILKLVEQEVDAVADYIRLTEDNKSLITSFETGNAMIIANNDKVSVYLKASEKEIKVFNPKDKKKSTKKAKQ